MGKIRGERANLPKSARQEMADEPAILMADKLARMAAGKL